MPVPTPDLPEDAGPGLRFVDKWLFRTIRTLVLVLLVLQVARCVAFQA